MSILDGFLNFMKLNDDEYEDDDFFDDDYEEEEKSKKNFFKKEKKYEDDEEEFDDTPKSKSNRNNSGKVIPMRNPGKKGNGMEVCVIRPTTMDDSREVCETLLSGSTVILNLEGMDLEVAQRIIDFTSGATFAISGNLQKISNFIFLVTPTNVDISGDLQDLLNTSFEVPSIKTRY